VCLYVGSECHVCRAWHVLGDTRHDSATTVVLGGLAVSCVSARACAWCVAGSAALDGVCVRCVLCLRNVKNRGCVIRAMFNARVGLALLPLFREQWLGCYTAVLRLRICVVTCAYVSLWLLCDCERCVGLFLGLIAVFVRPAALRCAHACVGTAALQCESGFALRLCCRW
jgi:hypothetical protein